MENQECRTCEKPMREAKVCYFHQCTMCTKELFFFCEECHKNEQDKTNICTLCFQDDVNKN